MGTTPTYGLRYQELGDAPDGAGLGENLAADVEAELVRVDAELATKADEPTEDTWHALVVSAPYTAVGALPPEYRIDTAGNVHLRGRVNRGGAAGGTVAFTLPAGYRPATESYGVAVAIPTSTSLGWLVVRTTGAVEFEPNVGAPTAYQIDHVFSVR